MALRSWAAYSAAALLALGLASCSGTRGVRSAQTPAEPAATAAASHIAPSPTHRAQANSTDIQEVSAPGMPPVAVPSPGAIQQIGWESPAGPVSGAGVAPAAFTPAMPRQACPDSPSTAACPPYCAPGGAMPGMMPVVAGAGVLVPAPSPANYPDEYLCDGGDRQLPVHYDTINRIGLDTQDTVVEYVDHVGVFHVKPTNPVCVYAPRFGAMRTVSSPVAGIGIDQAIGTDQLEQGVGLRARTATGLHLQNERLDGILVRSRPSGLNTDTAPIGIRQRFALASNIELTGTYQDLQFFRTGEFVRTEEARLATGIQAALTWTRDQNPVILAKGELGQQVEGIFTAQALVGVEDRRKPGELRIVKLADRTTAKPGDVLAFTLRYDNLGDFPHHHVRIVDNLTPRLEYVEGSVVSDRPGDVVAEPNGEGSHVLTFHLDEPLPGHEGGIITFKARVR